MDLVSGRIRVSRDVRFEEGRQWLWDETTKFKESPRSTFTIEGYNQEDTNLEDENDLTDEPIGSFEGINDEEFQTTSQTHVHGDEGLSTPTQSSVTFVGSTSPATSTTSGGAPKRYHLLTDLYEECDELLFIQDADEPTSYLTAAKDREWVKAIKDELDAIEKNQTWSLVDLPASRKPIGLKWVYKLKQDPSGNILKHKARLVAKGYVQKPGVDFDKVHYLDVKSAFLYGRLEEEVYVTQSKGYVNANHPVKVYKLSKALYGLRQAPRAWNSRLDKCLKGLNLRCALEYVVYTRKYHGNVLIVGVYVDDLIVTGNYDGDAKYFKQQMNKEFKMSDMGLLSYYLGIEVTQHEDGITLKQSTCARNVHGETYNKTYASSEEDLADRRSTCRMAEFMAATTTTYQGIWVSRLVHEIIGKKAGLFYTYIEISYKADQKPDVPWKKQVY
ncbi:ribonuclease H-like domain, reverse transcriptase, RNA-dependent DNA polymerase [Tanacetum coccineum]